jgi:hypothetical protein
MGTAAGGVVRVSEDVGQRRLPNPDGLEARDADPTSTRLSYGCPMALSVVRVGAGFVAMGDRVAAISTTACGSWQHQRTPPVQFYLRRCDREGSGKVAVTGMTCA